MKMNNIMELYYEQTAESKVKAFDLLLTGIYQELGSILHQAREKRQREYNFDPLFLLVSSGEKAYLTKKYKTHGWYDYFHNQSPCFMDRFKEFTEYCLKHNLDLDWSWREISIDWHWGDRGVASSGFDAVIVELIIKVSSRL